MNTNEIIPTHENLKQKKQENNSIITLYHGSDKIIESPQHGKGNKFNDYGLGFYTTPIQELAAEWAVPKPNADGYINTYTLDLTNLKVLDMDKEPFEQWVSTLIMNRCGKLAEVVIERQQKWLDKFPIATTTYDVIKGWRADDAYFSFIRDFFNVGLSLEKLKIAMRFGNLGLQIAVMSKIAFKQLIFVPPAKKILSSEFHHKRKNRDDEARTRYRHLANKTQGTNLFDIIGRD